MEQRTAEEFEQEMRQRVMEKIQRGENLTGKDLLVLQGYVEIYDPSLQAKKQVSIRDYFYYRQSLEETI